MRRGLFFAFIGAAIATLPGNVQAQKQAAATPKLTAEQILSKYVSATGGEKAYKSIKTMLMKVKVEVTAQNITGTGEIYFKSPDRIYSQQNIQGIGKIETGFDGKEGWAKDPIHGLRTLKGVELAQLKEQAADTPAKWRQNYTKTEFIGIRKVEGKDTYAVRLTPKQGKPSVQYFDTQTFLVTRVDMVQESPQGSIPVESYLSDYRSVNGIKIPFKTRARVAAAEQVVEVTDVKMNIPVSDTLFKRPKSDE